MTIKDTAEEWEIRASETPFVGKKTSVRTDDVVMPDGSVVRRDYQVHPGSVAVLAVDDQDRVLLVRQYRHATGGYLLEVPAGKLDAGEAPEVCARREIEEEIGRRAGRLDSLGWIWTTPGFTDEKIWLWLARDLARARQSLQMDEVLTIETIPFAEAARMAELGEIVDAKSAVAILRAAAVLRQRR